jgi:dihydroorotate dehydrogenase (fumarate)
MTIDLTTRYLGLTLRNPIVISACPLTGELDVLQQLERVGAAAAVLPSLFEEQLEQPRTEAAPPAKVPEIYVENIWYYPELKHYNKGPDAYLRHIEQAKKRVSIPIIASLNGTTDGPWLDFARRMQDAGADALEVNVYLMATYPGITSQEIEEAYVRVVARAREVVTIPLAVKVGPWFTAFANMAQRFAEAGANGLVLFNRFIQPEINLDKLTLEPRLELSTPDEIRLPLRWVSILHGRLPLSLAATSGIHFPDDVLKVLLAGADVAMIASALYRHGINHLATFVDALSFWLANNDFPSIEQIKGRLSYKYFPDTSAFGRATYTKAITSFANRG